MQAEVLNSLQRDYKEKGLVLVTGAGVSHRSGLPDWEELLKRLEKPKPAEGEPSITERLKADGYTLPSIVSVLEAARPEGGGPGQDFAREIQRQLYREFPYKDFPLEDWVNETADKERFVRHENLLANVTLRAVAGLCVRKADDGFYERNPLIRAIVTTNVDSLLRSYIRIRFKNERGTDGKRRGIIRSIDRASAGRVPGRIPVYYMHGFIRFDKDVGDVEDHAADLRVFTEQEFFDFFDDPNSLYNYTFLYLLREYPCLFIGMSLKDDNIRRLLHYSKRERVNSYKREGREDEAEDESNRHYLINRHPVKKVDGKEVKDEAVAELNEISLRRLGVKVLWVDEYDDISKRLGELYNSAGGSWSDVFDGAGDRRAPRG